jgi:hypothetical protein
MSNRIAGFLVKSQQYYLKSLGYYEGEINGVWNDACREAMDVYKLDESFKPANIRRSNGPFVPFERLPKGFKWEVFDGQRGIIKADNLPYHLVVQQLIDGILGVDETDRIEERRSALQVLGIKEAKPVESGDSGSIDDFIANKF